MCNHTYKILKDATEDVQRRERCFEAHCQEIVKCISTASLLQRKKSSVNKTDHQARKTMPISYQHLYATQVLTFDGHQYFSYIFWVTSKVVSDHQSYDSFSIPSDMQSPQNNKYHDHLILLDLEQSTLVINIRLSLSI